MRSVRAAESWSTTTVMAIAALGAALIAIFGDKQQIGGLTIAFALAGLVPWAAVAGGIRVHPVVMVVSTLVPAAVIVLADRNPGGSFPLMLTVVWVTRSLVSSWLKWATLAASAGIIVGLALLEDTTHETGTIYFLGGLAVAWMAGTMVRRQERLVAELQAAQGQQVEHAASVERARIAREVHDVVAHSLTVTLLHVTGARRALATDPSRAAEALERAETIGRESLGSIRQVVLLLRADELGQPSSAPLPRLEEVPALVEQFRAAGLDVQANVQLDGVDPDPATSLAGFRVVQESLSNVLQHAPGASVSLSVAAEPGGERVRIEAENPVAPGARRSERMGLGVRGMTERVRAAGGSLDAGLTEVGTWKVAVTLPLRATAAART